MASATIRHFMEVSRERLTIPPTPQLFLEKTNADEAFHAKMCAVSKHAKDEGFNGITVFVDGSSEKVTFQFV